MIMAKVGFTHKNGCNAHRALVTLMSYCDQTDKRLLRYVVGINVSLDVAILRKNAG